ncbi:MAG: acylphosphatase [Rhizobiales bacterium]|nr:acylphosphatase [Hyphomicrobiales bacterium]
MSGAIRHVTVTGRVQGVGYRAWVAGEASARHLEGWVRNVRNGNVEALFAGPVEAVADIIAACRRGPSMARVEAVKEDGGNPDALGLRRAGERFSVLPTV